MINNPFAELQSYQQPTGPGLGNVLATPQAMPPSQQATGGMQPPVDDNDYAARVQGWTGALSELISQPQIAAMLIQMGTGLSSGQSGGEAIAGGFGAMGRSAALGEQFRKQGEVEALANRRVGVEEREVAARERLTDAQIRNYERLARGGGGGAGAGAGGQGQLKVANVKVGTQTMPVFYSMTVGKDGRPVVSVYDVTGTPITDAQAIRDIMTQIGSGPVDNSRALEWAGKYGLPGDGGPYDLASRQVAGELQPQGQPQPQAQLPSSSEALPAPGQKQSEIPPRGYRPYRTTPNESDFAEGRVRVGPNWKARSPSTGTIVTQQNGMWNLPDGMVGEEWLKRGIQEGWIQKGDTVFKRKVYNAATGREEDRTTIVNDAMIQAATASSGGR